MIHTLFVLIVFAGMIGMATVTATAFAVWQLMNRAPGTAKAFLLWLDRQLPVASANPSASADR